MENDTVRAEKLRDLMNDKDFVQELAKTPKAEDVKKLFAERGLVLTEDEIQDLGRIFKVCIQKAQENGGELSEEDLAQVSGGFILTGICLTTFLTTGLGSAAVLGALGGFFGFFSSALLMREGFDW